MGGLVRLFPLSSGVSRAGSLIASRSRGAGSDGRGTERTRHSSPALGMSTELRGAHDQSTGTKIERRARLGTVDAWLQRRTPNRRPQDAHSGSPAALRLSAARRPLPSPRLRRCCRLQQSTQDGPLVLTTRTTLHRAVRRGNHTGRITATSAGKRLKTETNPESTLIGIKSSGVKVEVRLITTRIASVRSDLQGKYIRTLIAVTCRRDDPSRIPHPIQPDPHLKTLT
ncbi:unnamed protein product [Lota lota]